VKTAMSVGQARGVIMVTAAEAGLKIIEVTPLQVKIAATGYGKADKSQVLRMIMKLLNLKKIPTPDDAADACAIAWAGIGRIKLASLK
ncbi:MAG TPA: crossover junction endodeoxyribonuclease RuvC, partial [Patescibacteria group bacterium]|nr:crossover junction endodeoxyribonuclease RuvC [Patescibacteria group bacterium]